MSACDAVVNGEKVGQGPVLGPPQAIMPSPQISEDSGLERMFTS